MSGKRERGVGDRCAPVRHAPAVAEMLESRRLLSAAIAPTLHSLKLSAAQNLGGGVAASAIYSALSSLGTSTRNAIAAVAARSLSPFSLNLQPMKQALAAAPVELSPGADAGSITLPLPMPDGTLSRFRVVEAPVMEPGLALKFPEIKTYRGIGIDDPTARLRMDYTPLGFHAQVLSVSGNYYIDPFFRNDAAGTYVSYFKRDMIKGDPLDCQVVDTPGALPLSEKDEDALDRMFEDSLDPGITPSALTFGSQLKTYRIAVAADGEYTQAVGGGTVSGGQAAVVTAINRVTGIYETELGIRLTLVANNSSLIYTSAATDPYSNSNPSLLLSQNQSNIDSVIGNANYDIGHVFTTGGGGLAALGVVGKTGLKAQGETGLPNPTGDAFWVDFVAHEMGHQFGANHSFNTSADPNRNASTAYEPGSGSTIMGYAGIVPGEDLQPHSDPYFHSVSIDEIRSYISTGTIASVGTTSSTGNNGPTISAGVSYTIPTGTPFILTATGSDPDGDTLTYDWQERDLGVATLLGTDNGTSPIIRAWVPSTSPSRIVPRLSNLLNNTFATGEMLPAVSRASFKWRVIARDNRVGGGGVASSDVTLSVVNTGASFAVTAPNSAGTWYAEQTQLVSWNVAGTTGSGINTSSVNILLSTDGGFTWPHVLATGTANDGSQSITVPSGISTSTARIKVEAVGNIFFDLSNVNFTVVNGPPPPGEIAGQTFEDRNADGFFNGTDVALNGLVVYLDLNNDGDLDGGEPSDTTSGSGNFNFPSLTPGTYHVRQILSGSYVQTAPASPVVDVLVTSGATATTPNFLNFPIVYNGTGGADNYLLRLTNSSVVSPFYSDNFNRATLNGGTYNYTLVETADGGASIVSNVLTLTNDASGAGNGIGAAYVHTPTSAFGGFNQQLNLNTGLLTWTFNMRQIRSNPGGFASGSYGAAVVLGATSSIFGGAGAGNGYAVAIGNSGNTDPVRLVRFSSGLNGTLTTLAEDSGQDATNHYWSIRVTYNPATNGWSLFTRDDGASSFANPISGVTDQSGSTVTDSTYTSTPLTHSGAYWAYSTNGDQTASFDNFNLTLPSGGPPKMEILVNGIVTYSAPPNFPPSLAFNLGGGSDLFTLDSTNGTPVFPVTFTGQSGIDTWRFIGGTHAIGGDAAAHAENFELLSSAIVTFSATQTFGSLTIDGTSRASLAADGSQTLHLNTLSISAGGTLDLNDNDLTVDAGNFSTMRALVTAGFGNSSGGIISSTATGSQILALFDNSLFGATEWNGRTISAGAIVGKYTYFGDLNFDGKVTGDDYIVIDANLNTDPLPGIEWLSGDANMDGIVTGDDATVVDANLGAGAGNPLTASRKRRTVDEIL